LAQGRGCYGRHQEAELESKVGAKGRRKFEKFLREVAEDEDEDVIELLALHPGLEAVHSAYETMQRTQNAATPSMDRSGLSRRWS
jgi:hypothetical protein